MPITPLSNVLQYPQGEAGPLPEAAEFDIGEDGTIAPRMEGGAKVTELGDGSVVIDLDPQAEEKATSDKFNSNLAEELDESKLAEIASELIQGIEADDDSRQEWLSTHAEGIKLLGLVVEDNRSTATDSGAPLENMSAARHPMLLEAVLQGQATARGELLPASGPVKVRDDRPNKPPMMGHNGGPPMPMPPPAPPVAPPMAGPPGQPPGPMPSPMAMGPVPPPPVSGGPLPPASAVPAASPPPMLPGMAAEEPRDELADALEKDFNHYLTAVAQEYYPDTDRLLFGVFFGGLGIKKVYNCPIRRRPVSESIAMEDFIVSNALTDLSNASRITHRIKMRQSTLKRMQILNVYRNIELGEPAQGSSPNAVDNAKAEISGVQPMAQNPKDADYELYECYCELNLEEDTKAPEKFRKKGLALPYRVTLERDSQKILEIRRNWKENDDQCMPKEFFVEFPYDKAFGFYGIGLLHILGNTTKTLTAAWRELIDSGMFANFPGFIYAKGAGRQLTNQFRVPPGGGIGLDVGLQSLQNAVMPLPYKDLGPAFVGFIQHVEELGQRLGGVANISVGEGKQDAPVGTTLALIEQATKPIGAVLKRLHTAQGKEFQLLKERFREDPEAFWRFNRRPAMDWRKEQFLKAIEDYDFVPVSDPNNPTKMHRMAKASALQQIATSAPGLLDPKKVWRRVADNMEINDPDDLLAPPQAPNAPQPTPADQAKMMQAQAKMQGDQIRSQADIQKVRIQQEGDLAELQQRERIALINLESERMKLAANLALGTKEAESKERVELLKLAAQREGKMMDHIHQHAMRSREQEQETNEISVNP